jgi:hypothetical protein
MSDACSTNGVEEERVQVIGRKTKGNETARKTKTYISGNIRMNLGEVGWGDVDWIGLAQDRNRWRALCEFGIEPSDSMKC